MKSATDLALEYWSLPVQQRINNTVQDYVFNIKQVELDDHIKRRLELAKEKQGLINEIDELRKRIEKAIDAVWNDKCSHTVIDILKGTTND